MVFRPLLALSGVITLLPAVVGAQPTDPAIVLESGGIEFPDGSIQDSAHRTFEHVVVVAKEGGQFPSISQAILSITGGTDAPAEDNEFMVKVMPGVYQEQVTMASWVDVRGVGKRLVKIRHSGAPTIHAAADSEIAGLTIQNTSAAAMAIGVACYQVDRFSIRDAAIEVDGSTASHGIEADDCLLHLSGVDIEAKGATESVGILGESGNFVQFSGGSITIPPSATTQKGYGIWNDGSLAQLSGVVVNSGATAEAYGVKNDASSTLHIRRSRVGAFIHNGSVTDAASFGVDLDGGWLQAHQSTIGILGGSSPGLSQAVRAQNSAIVDLFHSDVTAFGDFGDYAISLLSSSTANIVYTGLQGLLGPFGAPANYNCLGAYAYTAEPLAFTPLDETCSPLP